MVLIISVYTFPENGSNHFGNRRCPLGPGSLIGHTTPLQIQAEQDKESQGTGVTY